MYKPLPSYLTIKPSKINGLGLFATKDIRKNSHLGITHIQNNTKIEDTLIFANGWIRTPLGGFYNHSDTPNCVLYDSKQVAKVLGIPTKILMTIKDISQGEELTCTYTLYSLDDA